MRCNEIFFRSETDYRSDIAFVTVKNNKKNNNNNNMNFKNVPLYRINIKSMVDKPFQNPFSHFTIKVCDEEDFFALKIEE